MSYSCWTLAAARQAPYPPPPAAPRRAPCSSKLAFPSLPCLACAPHSDVWHTPPRHATLRHATLQGRTGHSRQVRIAARQVHGQQRPAAERPLICFPLRPGAPCAPPLAVRPSVLQPFGPSVLRYVHDPCRGGAVERTHYYSAALLSAVSCQCAVMPGSDSGNKNQNRVGFTAN